MPENRGADGPGDEPDGVDHEDVERRDDRIGLGEEQLGEDEAGRGGVKKEVVPLDRRPDCAGDNSAIELSALANRRGRLH
jgi:hypothetical protein